MVICSSLTPVFIIFTITPLAPIRPVIRSAISNDFSEQHSQPIWPTPPTSQHCHGHRRSHGRHCHRLCTFTVVQVSGGSVVTVRATVVPICSPSIIIHHLCVHLFTLFGHLIIIWWCLVISLAHRTHSLPHPPSGHFPHQPLFHHTFPRPYLGREITGV